MTTSKQDRGSARTATELEQKYDLASIPRLKVAVELSETGLNKTNAILEEFINATLKSLENMQDQIDGSITTWFEKGVPTLANKPANEWSTEEDKKNHLGDLYYDQDSGYGYRFSLVNNAYEWTRITDNDIVKALAMAAAAQDTADSKRRVFVENPVPPYDSGDLWINGGELYRCQISKDKYQVYEEKDFIIATKYTDDTYAIKVEGELKVLSGTVTTIKEGFDSFKVDITTTVDTLDSQLLIAQTSIEANTEEIKFKVSKNGVIGAINLSEEEALIQAKKINLVGAVTISALDSNLNSTITNASTNASNAVTTANTANSTANATKSTLDSLCVLENNVTVIDGSKIYTGSITAKKIDIENLFAQDIVVNGSFKGATFISNLNDDVTMILGESTMTGGGSAYYQAYELEGIKLTGKANKEDGFVYIGTTTREVRNYGTSTYTGMISIQASHPLSIMSFGDIEIVDSSNVGMSMGFSRYNLTERLDSLQRQINTNVTDLDAVNSEVNKRLKVLGTHTQTVSFPTTASVGRFAKMTINIGTAYPSAQYILIRHNANGDWVGLNFYNWVTADRSQFQIQYQNLFTSALSGTVTMTVIGT